MQYSENADDYFNLVQNDFFALRLEWRTYRFFFGTNPETVEFLNSVSRHTTFTLERVLFERTLLGIRKLTDRFEQKRSSTRSVTIKGLPKYFHTPKSPIKRYVNNAERQSEFARNWASKRIAHSDLAYRQGADPLHTASRKKVEDSLSAISCVLEWVASEHYGMHLDTHPVVPAADEGVFLKTLYFGHQKLELMKAKRKACLEKNEFERFDELTNEIRNVPSWLMRIEPGHS